MSKSLIEKVIKFKFFLFLIVSRAAFSVAEDKDFDEGLRRVAELIREETQISKK